MDIISIIVPIYNVEKYIVRCVDSIINQTYVNTEIILVDDGSPDKCGSICDEYQRRDHRVIVIHKPNGGLSDARNYGINVASGKYITFIDSDDWVTNDYLEKLYNLLIDQKADISICNHQRVYSIDSNIIKEKKITIYEFTNIEALNYLTDSSLYIQMIVSWGKLYKTELFKYVMFPVGKIHEDEFTTYKLYYFSKKIVYTNEPLLYYLQRNDSIMGRGFNIKSRLHKIEAFEERIKFYEHENLLDLALKTYRTLFILYYSISENIQLIENYEERKIFAATYREFMIRLMKSNQPASFRLYYTSCNLTPNFMKRIFRKLTNLAISIKKRLW